MLMADPLTSERLAYWTYQRGGSFHDSMIGQARVEDQERFPCSKCHRSYRNKNHLSRHIRYECDRKKQYKCEYCFKDFYRRDNLKTHVNLKHPAHAIFPDGSQKGAAANSGANSVSPDGGSTDGKSTSGQLAIEDSKSPTQDSPTGATAAEALALVTPKRPFNASKIPALMLPVSAAVASSEKNRENSKTFGLKHPDSIIAVKIENPVSQEAKLSKFFQPD